MELSVNCTRAKDCDYVLGTDSTYGCDACDDACMKVAIEDARDAMSPLAWGTIFIFSILVIVGVFNDYLMERATFGAAGAFDDGEKDTMEWIGVGLNGLIALFSLILVILGGIYSDSGSWTAYAILFLGVSIDITQSAKHSLFVFTRSHQARGLSNRCRYCCWAHRSASPSGYSCSSN